MSSFSVVTIPLKGSKCNFTLCPVCEVNIDFIFCCSSYVVCKAIDNIPPTVPGLTEDMINNASKLMNQRMFFF